MQIKKRLLGFIRLLFVPLPDVPRYWSETFSERSNSVQSNNTKLETERGRCESRGHIQRFVQRLWDTTEKSRRMEKILRKSPRKEEGEGVSEKEARATERNIRLKRIYENRDFEVIRELLIEIESIAYYGLKHPDLRKDGLSNDYYYGNLSGQIEVIEHIRNTFERAILSLQKKSIEDELKKNEKQTNK